MAQQQNPDLVWETEGSANKWLVMLSVMIGTFMAVLDATIVSVAFPKMMAVFGVSVDQIEWVMTAYMFAFVVVSLLPDGSQIALDTGLLISWGLHCLLPGSCCL